MQNTLELLIGVLNGTVGDYLKRTGNGLSTPMQIVRDGAPVELTAEALGQAFPAPSPRVAVFVHGLMSIETVWQMPGGESYGSLLARDLGVTPIQVRYNSGLHIAENGALLDRLLDDLVRAYPAPITELLLFGHSMGGLLLRSAAHVASEKGSGWLPLARRTFYLGTPHLGAPLERAGNVLTWALAAIPNPYTRLLADIGNLRSLGVKDLRYGSLHARDWEGESVDALLRNRRHPVPLLPHTRHHLVAGSLLEDPRLALLFGDAMVPLRSATGRARPGDRSAPFSQDHVRVLPGVSHLGLAHDMRVYELLRAWCGEHDAEGPAEAVSP